MIRVMLCDDDPFILKLVDSRSKRKSQRKSWLHGLSVWQGRAWNFFASIQKNPGEYLVFDLDFGAGRLKWHGCCT